MVPRTRRAKMSGLLKLNLVVGFLANRKMSIADVPEEILRKICHDDLQVWRTAIQISNEWRAIILTKDGPQNPWDWFACHPEDIPDGGDFSAEYYETIIGQYILRHGINEKTMRKLLRIALINGNVEVHKALRRYFRSIVHKGSDAFYGETVIICYKIAVYYGGLPAGDLWMSDVEYYINDYYTDILVANPQYYKLHIRRFFEDERRDRIKHLCELAKTTEAKLIIWEYAGKNKTYALQYFCNFAKDMELLCSWDPVIMRDVVRNELQHCKLQNIAAVEWWHSYGIDFDSTLWGDAISTANIEIMEWALEHSIKFEWKTFDIALTRGNLADFMRVMQWIHDHLDELEYLAAH